MNIGGINYKLKNAGGLLTSNAVQKTASHLPSVVTSSSLLEVSVSPGVDSGKGVSSAASTM